MLINSTFPINNNSVNKEWAVLFNEEIPWSIEKRTAVAAVDIATKNDKIGEYWALSEKDKNFEIKNQMCYKTWVNSMPGVEEVVVLLELISVLERKGRSMRFDNKKYFSKITRKISKSNMHA